MSSRFVSSKDGTKIYADAVGNPSNPSIIFVHGLALCGDVFDHIFSNEKVSNEFFLVRYDMRGHGRSGMPEDAEGYLSVKFAEDFAAVAQAFSLKQPILVGWSLGATVAVDIASHLPEGTLSAIVYLSALPYIGPIMKKIGTPLVGSFHAGLFTTDNVSLSQKTTRDFSESLFTNFDTIPFSVKCSWMGMAVFQSPVVRKLLLTRPQDPEKFYKLGKEGLPLLHIFGTADKQINGEALLKELEPYFVNLEVERIENGGHAVFYEDPDEPLSHIVNYARKINKRN